MTTTIGGGPRFARIACATLAAVALLAACQPPPPSPSHSPAATTPVSVQPSPSVVASAGSLSAADVSFALLPEAFTSNDPQTFGSELVWAMGGDAAPDLWRFEPARGGAPERLFVNPRRASVVGNVVRSEAGYAFAERNDEAFGDGGWRVWFLPAGAATPVEIDRGTATGARGFPTLALDDRRLAWAGFTEPPAGAKSFLRVAEIGSPAGPTTLLDLPIEEALIWYPILEANTVWYARILADFDYSGEGDEFHIESRNLADPGAPPTRFPGTANDFNLAVSERFFAWKTSKPGFAALNWGDIWLQPRGGGNATRLEVQNADEPSIGDRFVTFRELTSSKLVVYDLVRSELVDVTAALPVGFTRVGGQAISGDLLVCYVFADDGPPRIAWAMLPE